MAIFGKVSRAIMLSALLAVTVTWAYATPVVVRDQTDPLNGLYDDVKLLSVHTVVTLDAGVYTYKYTVDYLQGTAAVHIFSVDNPNSSYYDHPDTDSGFALPTYVPYEMIQYGTNNGPYFAQGQTRWFSYTSQSGPQDIFVYAYVMDGGSYAEGWTVGMGQSIPEPGTFAVLAFGLIGVVPRFVRRRK